MFSGKNISVQLLFFQDNSRTSAIIKANSRNFQEKVKIS